MALAQLTSDFEYQGIPTNWKLSLCEDIKCRKLSERLSGKFQIHRTKSELINVYQVIKAQPEELIILLRQYEKKHSKQFYYEVRDRDIVSCRVTLIPMYLIMKI